MGDLPLLRPLVDRGPPPTGDPAPLSAVKWIASDPAAVPVLALYFACIAGRMDAAAWRVTPLLRRPVVPRLEFLV